MSVVNPGFRKFLDKVAAVLDFSLRPRNFWTGLLMITFLASAIASLSLADRRAVVLWFPDAGNADGLNARTELRYVPNRKETAAMASDIVGELLLGPVLSTSSPISMPDVNLRSAIHSGKKLYVDISSDILFGRSSSKGIYEDPPIQPRLALDYIRRTLGWNFPFLDIIITVDGLEPSWETVEIANNQKFE
jgi:hypothetical protein